MATLRHYRAGGCYIQRGYPIRQGERDEDSFFTTIQVLPRADRFFDVAGYRDGRTIEREVFYAPLLDGDLSSPSIERRRPTVDNIPSQIINRAEGLADSEPAISLSRRPEIIQCRYLVDFYNVINSPGLKPDVSLAANICLARHLRQTAYERDARRRFS